MPDYGKPTTAAEALRQSAKDLEFYIKVEDQKIADAVARRAAFVESKERLERDADTYEKWQPKIVQLDGTLTDGTQVHSDSYRRGVRDGGWAYCNCDFDPSFTGGLCDNCGRPEVPESVGAATSQVRASDEAKS